MTDQKKENDQKQEEDAKKGEKKEEPDLDLLEDDDFEEFPVQTWCVLLLSVCACAYCKCLLYAGAQIRRTEMSPSCGRTIGRSMAINLISRSSCALNWIKQRRK